MSSWHMRIHELQQWMTDDVVMIYLVIIWHWWRESFVSTCLGVFCEFSEVLNDSYKQIIVFRIFYSNKLKSVYPCRKASMCADEAVKMLVRRMS